MIVKPEAYLSLSRDIEKLPVFYEPWYLDIISQGNDWFVIVVLGKDNSVNGLWPIIKYKKWGITFAMNPLLMPYSGPILFPYSNIIKPQKKDSFNKNVISDLIDQLPAGITPLKVKCNPKINSWLPFYWKGFTQTTKYTYQLDVKNKETLEEGYTSKLRNSLKNPSVKFVESENAEIAFDLIRNILDKKTGKQQINKKLFLSLDAKLDKNKGRKMFFAQRSSGEDIATAYLILSHKTAYLMFVGSKGLTKEEGGVTRQLIHHAILNMPDYIEIFDFEGSMIEKVEYIFRSFGGNRTAYHEVSRVKGKWLQFLLLFK